MKDKILNWGPLVALASLNPLFYVVLISMIPIIELRGAIPIGLSLGLPWWQVLPVSIFASTIPAPFIILFFNKFLELLRKNNWFPWLINFLDKKFSGKGVEMGKSKFWGIALFVAIPLPGTGAWTASGIASLIEMDFKEALLAVFLGNCIAGVIVTIISLLGQAYLIPMLIVLVVGIIAYLVYRKMNVRKLATGSVDSTTNEDEE